MSGEIILAHDLGTTGNKASLVDREGRVLASSFPRLRAGAAARQLGRTEP